MIDTQIESQIQARLDGIERDHGVRIVYACESGSRAWGFASQDSDYDVRFIYVRPRDWYLSINVDFKRDVIELPIDDVLDINGWDVRKALGLLRKSNPPLMEWLGSPIVYRESTTTAQRMRQVVARYYNGPACAHHYLSMARGNYREYLQGELVWLKKYLYVLRPLLAVQWIEQGFGVAPTEFGRLVNGVVHESKLRSAIDDLLERKRRGAELEKAPRIAVLSDWIDQELSRLQSGIAREPGDSAPPELLNEEFRATLGEAWKDLPTH